MNIISVMPSKMRISSFLTIPTDEVEAVMKLTVMIEEDCVVFETGFAKAAAKDGRVNI
jgi:hypothetical protein